MKYHKHPIKITNFSLQSNAYRNLGRVEVDTLFFRADKLLRDSKYSKEVSKKDRQKIVQKARDLRTKARQKWRNIIEYSNNL